MAGIQALQIRSKQKVNKSSEGRSSLQSKVLPAEVNVVQKQVLNQQQSLEVVQTLLLSSVCDNLLYPLHGRWLGD